MQSARGFGPALFLNLRAAADTKSCRLPPLFVGRAAETLYRQALFFQFKTAKNSEPRYNTASTNAAHTTLVKSHKSHRLSLGFITPLPNPGSGHYSANSLSFHREMQKVYAV
jgi:hypothetical protein